MENEKETFWDNFFRKDNLGLLAMVLFLWVLSAIFWDTDSLIIIAVTLIVLAVDALLIYLGLNEDN